MADCFSQEFKSSDLKFFNNRLQTFETWSSQIQPNKFQLSSAGFYYTGRGDIVECFSCALRLHDWKKEDDPMIEHRKLSSDCLFLKMIGQSNSNNTSSSIDIWSSSQSPWSTPNTFLTFKDGGGSR